jgi:hypothetical protein
MEDNTNHCTKVQHPGETHNKPEGTNATKIQQKEDRDENKKWAISTYHNPKNRKLTKFSNIII